MASKQRGHPKGSGHRLLYPPDFICSGSPPLSGHGGEFHFVNLTYARFTFGLLARIIS